MSDHTSKPDSAPQGGKQEKISVPTPEQGVPAFNILTIRGGKRPYQATLHDGPTVQRMPYIDIPGLEDAHPQGLSRFQIVDYDDHFCYKHPVSENLFCTCGALAFVLLPTPGVPPVYFYKVTCKFDADTGFRGLHQTSILNKEGFKEKQAGTTIRVDEWMP